MLLYLFRHGIAVDRMDPDCPPDPQRPLTEKGVERTRAAARGLFELGVSPDLVLSSPYLRAIQTAQIAAEELDVDQENCKQTDDLLFGAEPEHLFARLAQHEGSDVLCAGHAPHLDLLLAHAVGMENRDFTWLKKAGAACLDLGEPPRTPARLVWLLEPRALRRLGTS